MDEKENKSVAISQLCVLIYFVKDALVTAVIVLDNISYLHWFLTSSVNMSVV